MKRVFMVMLTAGILTVSAGADAAPAYAPLFEASFLQGWLCRSWSPDEWKQELADMQAAGFRAVILQSSVDLQYEQTDLSKPKTDSSAFTLTSADALYPTALAEGSANAHALEYALAAAEQTGMRVYIGTVSDNRWWNYGWGVPDDGFSVWSSENAAQCSTVIEEIWQQFGDHYAAQIAGFYYNNEIWNIDAACDGSDGGAYVSVIGGNLRDTVETIVRCAPDKPLLISPFYNRDLSSASAYGAFWRSLADAAQLRPADIIAHQDGGGRDYDPETLREWADALRGAVGDRMRFWINNESFGTDYTAKDTEQLRQNYLTAPQAEKHILFSWNHYYHRKNDAAFSALMQQMTGDLNGDGLCSAADAAALSRWLTEGCLPDDWLAGDLDANGMLTACDLSMLKGILLRRT